MSAVTSTRLLHLYLDWLFGDPAEDAKLRRVFEDARTKAPYLVILRARLRAMYLLATIPWRGKGL